MKRDHAIRSMNSPGFDNLVLQNGMVEVGEYRIGGKTEMSTTCLSPIINMRDKQCSRKANGCL